jgi:hypothetical protein
MGSSPFKRTMAVEHDKWLPEPLRSKAVNYLRNTLHPGTMHEFQKAYHDHGEDWMVQHHFFAGMSLRNVLREVIKDDELPPVDYGDGMDYQNWDDYYVRVVEEAAGLYE